MVFSADGFCMQNSRRGARTVFSFGFRRDVFPFSFAHECCSSILSCEDFHYGVFLMGNHAFDQATADVVFLTGHNLFM
jgi:hypothetical protein